MEKTDPSAGLQKLANSSFEYKMNNIHTCIPAIVLNVDNLQQMRIDVQPTINKNKRDGSVEERPPVLNVPVQFPSSSTSAFTFPINKGDSVLLVFSMRGLDAWKRGNGYPAAPLDFRQFDKRDCFVIPGVFPFSKSINNPDKRMWPHSVNDTVVVHNIGQPTETEVRLLIGGGIIVNTYQDVEVNCNNATVTASSDITMNCDNMSINAASNIDISAATMSVAVGTTTWSGGINQAGDYSQSGTYTLDGININIHVHPILSGSSAPGPTGGPQ